MEQSCASSSVDYEKLTNRYSILWLLFVLNITGESTSAMNSKLMVSTDIEFRLANCCKSAVKKALGYVNPPNQKALGGPS